VHSFKRQLAAYIAVKQRVRICEAARLVARDPTFVGRAVAAVEERLEHPAFRRALRAMLAESNGNGTG
jgi:hypothetical protein